MKLENLPDEGHEKLIWKCSRDRSRERRHNNVTPRHGGDVPQWRYRVFQTYLRHRGDVLMWRRHYVPLRRRHDIPIRRREDIPLRRLGDIALTRGWVFHLRRTERRYYDVATTSCCRVGIFMKKNQRINSIIKYLLLPKHDKDILSIS